MRLLLDNSKLSDTSIANKLNISSQAVGRIRKKLEEEVIKGYTLELDPMRLGLNLLVMCKVHITDEGAEHGKRKVLEKLKEKSPHVSIYRVFGNGSSYMIKAMFKDLTDFNRFLEKEERQGGIFDFIKFDEIFSIPMENVMKSNSKPVLHDAIEFLGTKSTKIKFN